MHCKRSSFIELDFFPVLMLLMLSNRLKRQRHSIAIVSRDKEAIDLIESLVIDLLNSFISYRSISIYKYQLLVYICVIIKMQQQQQQKRLNLRNEQVLRKNSILC